MLRVGHNCQWKWNAQLQWIINFYNVISGSFRQNLDNREQLNTISWDHTAAPLGKYWTRTRWLVWNTTLNGCMLLYSRGSRCVQTFPGAALGCSKTNKKTIYMQFKIHALWTVLGGRRWRQAGLPVIGGGPAEEAFSSLGGNIPSTGCKYLGLFTESFTTHLFLQPSHPSAFCFRPLRGNSLGFSRPLMWPPDHGPVRWFVCWEEPRAQLFGGPSLSHVCPLLTAGTSLILLAD